MNMTIHTSFSKELQNDSLFLLVDLEATCWERLKVRDKNEIIEIGVCICDINGDILDKYQSFVKPRINKKLSGFCKKLTGIRQCDIDSSDILSIVILNIQEWARFNFSADLKKTKWCSWGTWDILCIENDCRRHDIDFPFGKHICLKHFYEEYSGIDCGLREAVRREGYKWEGSEHRALDDAYNSQKIAKMLLG